MKATEMQVGATVFRVITEYSEHATETVEQKLKRLILQSLMTEKNVIRKVSTSRTDPLDISRFQSEHESKIAD